MATHASNKPHVETFQGHRWVETGVKCPGCNQQISYNLSDPRSGLECGGPGEGICGDAHVAHMLGEPGWLGVVEEYKASDGRVPSLLQCARIMAAFNKADNIGKPYLAKANPRRR